ncbi:MAG TPA: CotH kinase family protein [Dongiaceae bacterium]|nr:CotH kinase family protein [Dongiaceae bacterium]
MKVLWGLLVVAVLISARAQTLFDTNATWKYFKGTSEASSPNPTTWRDIDFNDASWSTGAGPFYYENSPGSDTAYTGNTDLTDMNGGYACVFLRQTFVLTNPAAIYQLQLSTLSDDGCIVWINGVEVERFNMPEGDVPYNGTSSPALAEPVPLQEVSLDHPSDYLVPGTNVIAVQAFNSSLASSSDFLISVALAAVPDTFPPIASLIPAAGATVHQLSSLEVDFNKDVTGVDAADLLINGVAATNMSSYAPWQYVFYFPPVAAGTTTVAWDTNSGIADLLGNDFAGGNYTFTVNPNAQISGVEISEFMADNKKTLKDADGDTSDWIELYNATSADVNLGDWALAESPTNLMQWRFPNVILPANGYLVVFASGKDRTNATAELHTNFKLSAAGQFLALVSPETNIMSVFSPTYPAQQPDVSYGRDQISPDFVGYFSSPTPGAPNAPLGATVSAAVDFSRSGGTFSDIFNLFLSTADTNAVIRYTLDGTAPTEFSPVYTNPIAITHSLQVRARSFTPGFLPGPLRTESYIQLSSSLRNAVSDLPAFIIYNFGAGSIPVSTQQVINVSLYESPTGAVSLTNAPTLNARAGIRVRGRSTRYLPKQSWSLEFWDDYNAGRDLAPLGLPPESDWVLYAPNNFEPVLIHNPLVYQLSNDIGRYAPRTRFVEVYLNTTGSAVSAGNYNGIYVLEEKIKWGPARVDIPKLKEHDNTDPEVTGGYMMKIDDPGEDETGFYAAGQTIVYVEPKETDIKLPQRAPQQQYLQNYLDAFGLAVNGASYKDPTNGFRGYIDTGSWIDHHILNVMAFNVDALRLSAYFYKERNGKLHFGPVWDFDRTQGSTDGRDFNPRTWRSPSGDQGTDFFNYPWWGRMFTDIDFWQQWIDRYEDLRPGMLSTNHIFATIDTLVNQVRNEQPREVSRWSGFTSPRSGIFAASGYSYNFPGTYQGEVDFMKNWYAQRLNFMDTNFVAKPGLSHAAGAIAPGTGLALTGPAGATLYYTTNGTDPRLPGGRISSNALPYLAPIPINTNVTILVRAYDTAHHNLTGPNNPPLSSPWSGLTTAAYLTVTAPVITQVPNGLEAYVGQRVTLTVAAIGSPTPEYQWQLNTTNLDGQTNAQLVLDPAQTNESGIYTVWVTNSAGGTNLSATVTITPKPQLAVTEVMSSEATGTATNHTDWWELSNLGDFTVNLRGYRFDDSSTSLAVACTLATNDVLMAPGESVVMVEDMSADAFRAWWGPQNLRSDLKILTYSGSGLGLSSDGDAIHVWNTAAASDTDQVASVTFGTATRGVSFGYDAVAGIFGGLSGVGHGGAFVAAANGDIGSPGTLSNQPPVIVSEINAGSVTLSFATQPGAHYQIEYKDHLNDAVWTPLTNVPAAPNPLQIGDTLITTNASRFYRAVLLP